LVNLAVFLAAPLDVYGVNGGGFGGECLLVSDLFLVVEIKSEIASDECGGFTVQVIEYGAFVGVRSILAVFG
jgi:hypothetical protein